VRERSNNLHFMRNQTNGSIPLRSLRVFIFYFFLPVLVGFSHSHVWGQDNINQNSSSIQIYFGERLTSIPDLPDSEVTFELTHVETGAKQVGDIQSLRAFDFNVPGEYQLLLTTVSNHQQSDACAHEHKPVEMKIHVLNYRLEYDFSQAKFSKSLQGGVAMDGVEMIVPAKLVAYKGSFPTLSLSMRSAGLGADLVGKFSRVETVSNDLVNLHFLLEGQLQSGTFVMFDFTDEKGITKTYYYESQIR